MLRPPPARRFAVTVVCLAIPAAAMAAGILLPGSGPLGAVLALCLILLLWTAGCTVSRSLPAPQPAPSAPLPASPAPAPSATTPVRPFEENILCTHLFDLLQEGILMLDAGNRILRANAAAARLLKREPGSLAGLALPDAAQQPRLAELVESIRSTGSRQAIELPLPPLAGLAHVSGIPLLHAPADAPPHLLIVLRDVSLIRRLESAGEEYATNVSHELKTPLTLILGYAETLLSHGDIDAGFRERSLQTIQNHTKRIIRIIDDLLRLAWLRNESGSAGIPRSTVSVPAVVATAVSICREWARSAGVEITTRVPPDLVWHLNNGLIEEALINLLKNAILYALGGPVELHVRVKENGWLEFAVLDRGPGLKPEDAHRIFERFYRVDKGRARASGGSGLGLPIVQQIVEAHQGNARVESIPGEGSTFILEIPPGPPPAGSAPTPPAY